MGRKEQAMTLYSPEVSKVKGNRKYQRPTLPTNKQLMSARKRQQYVDQAFTYTRMFCGSLSGLSILLLIITAPLSWVQFLVTNNGLELYAGLWTVCHHELCWSHIPKPPYYLEYSRALFIISVLCMVTGLGLLFSSCRPTEGIVSAELDLKVSILSFCSAFCLLLCLNLFLAQVEWYTTSAMESVFLWAYYLNWCGDVLHVCAGIVSFLNYVTFQSHPPDPSVRMTPQQKSRPGFGPVPTTAPAATGKSSPEMQFLSGRGERQPSTRGERQPSTRGERQPSTRGERQPSTRGERRPGMRGERQPSTRL
ncbi:transmembrane protein 202 isoform X2 [Peromyscus californicus insignis]|uniref:transmembrane protein 202 isoform X2 n=1 Tax=Peromyscus californicus insignis TaxID=564181 RepID=UPI0022A781C2|nr:transmembrane protein 202 isoform X2 [Peromyscus californicus insignis]